MKLTETHQLEFTTLLFDVLFSLVLFFGIDSFLEIKIASHFIFYIAANIVLIHWWLIYKSAYDMFGTEITNSVTYIIIGIIELIFLDYFIMSAAAFHYTAAVVYLLALFAIDFIWAVVWRYAGQWQTKDEAKIRRMEGELDSAIRLNAIMAVLLLGMTLTAMSISFSLFFAVFIGIYTLFIFSTFKKKIIDLKIF